MSKLTGKREVNMLSGSLFKNLMIFAIPLALTGILQQLFNAADVAVVGRLVGKQAMAAVGANGPVVGLVITLFTGVSMGCNVVLAKLTGMRDEDAIHRAVDTALILAVICGVISTVAGQLFAEQVMHLISVPEEIFNQSLVYIKIYFWGLPFILLYNFEAAIFRSQGDSVTPLVSLVVSGVINVGLNIFFVLACNMQAEGVALATSISSFISSGILFWVMTHSDTAISIKKHTFAVDKKIMKEMIRIGLPTGIQGAVFSISNICIQSAINSLGTDVIAASSAAFNVEIIPFYVVNAFGQACTTFTGQNVGAGNYSRCRKVMINSLELDLAFTLVISALMIIFGRPLLSVFNKDPIVIDYGYLRIKYILYAESLNVMIEIFSGAMRGRGWALEPAILTLIGVCGVRITWVFYVFPKFNDFGVLLWCYPLSWLVTTIALVITYTIKVNKEQLL